MGKPFKKIAVVGTGLLGTQIAMLSGLLRIQSLHLRYQGRGF